MKNILKMIGLILLYFFTYIISSIFVGIAFGLFFVFKNIIFAKQKMAPADLTLSIQSQIPQYTNIILIATSIISLILFWVIFIVRKRKLFRECNFSKITLKNVALLVVGGISLSIFISLALSLVIEAASLQRFMPGYDKITKSLVNGNVFWAILSVCLVAPAFEEIFFRSILFNELKKNMPIALAMILQAALFGVFHMNLIQGCYAFILGIIFSLLYVWTKSLWAPIIMHMFFNTTSLLVSRIPDKQIFDKFGLLFLISGLFVCAVALIFIYKDRKVEVNTVNKEAVNM